MLPSAHPARFAISLVVAPLMRRAWAREVPGGGWWRAPATVTRPAADCAPGSAAICLAPVVGKPAPIRWARKLRLNAEVTTAPRRAMPNPPPISRLVLVAAEATP